MKDSKKTFKGFSIRYPVYTVTTPQTGEEFNVRSLTVSEVDFLKESLPKQNTAYDQINKIIWDAVESSPPNINSYQDFMERTTMKDREALIYGIYYMTFGEKKEFDIHCENIQCNSKNTIAVELDKIMSINKYPYSRSIINSYKIANAQGAVEKEMDKILSETAWPSFTGLESPPEGMPEASARQDEYFKTYFEKYDETRKVINKSAFEPNKEKYYEQKGGFVDEMEPPTSVVNNSITVSPVVVLLAFVITDLICFSILITSR
jgi:hypothetical protein